MKLTNRLPHTNNLNAITFILHHSKFQQISLDLKVKNLTIHFLSFEQVNDSQIKKIFLKFTRTI